MKKLSIITIGLFFTSAQFFAQQTQEVYKPQPTNFFSDVKLGGALGLGFGNGFTNIAIAPTALKPITEQLAFGAGLQFNYLKSKGFYESTSYGMNLLGIYSPAEMIQLSAEVEQLRVNNTFIDNTISGYHKENFWNTALFLGAGYTSGNATIGIRYNVLYKDDNLVYNQAWMPFIRVFF